MHSCELITDLRAKKVLCHRVEVVKNFRCYNHRLCFLQHDWLSWNSSWKSNQLNEAQGIGWRSPDPFSLVRGRGLGMRLASMWRTVVLGGCGLWPWLVGGCGRWAWFMGVCGLWMGVACDVGSCGMSLDNRHNSYKCIL